MAKFDPQLARRRNFSPMQTIESPALTATGGVGVLKDAKTELFQFALSNLVSEKTFHEDVTARDERFVKLVHAVTQDDPDWVRRFIPYLRDVIGMRSAPLVMAVEYGLANGPGRRDVVNSALLRADEPAEILAYWLANYPTNKRIWRNQGAAHNIPKWLKRGVADAATRLYNEFAVLQYDGQDRNIRMADVLSLTHPQAKADWQNDLFKYVLNRRYGVDEVNDSNLPMIKANKQLRGIPVEMRRQVLEDSAYPQWFKDAGFKWSDLSGWLQGPMDAKAWEAIIPSMGFFALVRNLRNFEQAGISAEVQEQVAKRLMDPEQARKSRMFPMRFYAAYKEINSDRYRWPLSVALDNVLQNVPSLPGTTLILVDCSYSMHDPMSGRSKLSRAEVAGLFGSALALRAEHPTLVRFGHESGGEEVSVPKGGSVLKLASEFRARSWNTYTFTALNEHYNNHDRVVILTDGQAHDAGLATPKTMIYTFDLGGYQVAHKPTGSDHAYFGGGLSDSGFVALAELEKFRTTGWPF